MKTNRLASVLLACATFYSVGCATTPNPASNTAGQEVSSDRRSYSQKELMKRGRPTVAGALEAQDATIRTR